MKKLTNEQFLERANKIHNFEYEYLNEYVNAKTKMKIKHIICQGIFEQTPDNHLHGQKCSYCSGRNATKENNLLIKNPELCKEWDYEKNYPLRPEQFLSHSNKKVWWKCKLNHSWQATINNRVNERNCPNCYNKDMSIKISLGKLNDKNRFSLHAPQKLLNEFDNEKNLKELGLTINDVSIHSGKKVWWICSVNKNHKWKAVIGNRVDNNKNCPYCIKWKIEKDCKKIFEQIFKIKFEKKRFYCFTTVKNLKSKSFIEFDGYNDEFKIAFEYQGYQHYIYPNFFHRNKLQFQKQRSLDLFKQQFCLTNNIKLIIIPYWTKDLKNYIKEKLSENK